jgi:hypothetical protein
MIIKIVEGFYEDVRFRLMENEIQVVLDEGDMLEFKADVLTKENGMITIEERTMARDLEDRIVLGLDTEKYGIVPGRYNWELNLIREGEADFNLLPGEYNELIIIAKEGA